MHAHPAATPRWLDLVLLVALLGGCGEDDVDPCRYRLCSIDDPACVEQVSATIACQLDADESVLPVVRFMTAAEVVEEIEAELQDPTPEEVRDVTDYYHGEALVGLMPETYVYGDDRTSFVDWAIAYYSGDTKEVVIITDNVGDDRERAYAVLVHEMVHVYQDAARDLGALVEAHGTTFDRFLGLRAMIEGEAEHYESLAELALLGLHPHEVDWYGYFDEFQAYVLEAAAESEAPTLDVLGLFPYAYGSEFVYMATMDSTRGGVDEVFERPPDSARQVMKGYAVWPDRYGNGDAELDPHAAPVLAERYEYLGGGPQSVWLINAMLQRTAGYSGTRLATSLDGVSADELAVFRNAEDGTLAAVWRIQSDQPDVLYRDLLAPGSSWAEAGVETGPRVAARVDADVVLVATSGSDASVVLAEIQGWQSRDELTRDDPPPDAAVRSRLLPHGAFPSR